MSNDGREAWTFKAVWTNTAATVISALFSGAAVVIAIIAFVKASG